MRRYWPMVVLSFALATQALADRNLVGTASVTAGFSDNILGVPETDDPTDAQVEADIFLNISPGAQLSFDRRDSFHLLNYIVTTRFFATHPEANSISNRLEYLGNFFRSPVTTLVVTGGLAAGVINTIDRTSPLLDDQVVELPQGDVGFIRTQGSATINHQMNIDWSTSATGGMRIFRRLGVDNAATNFVLPGQFSLRKNYRRHAVGASLAATYSASAGGNRERPQTIFGGPRAFWAWDISEGWSSNITGGLAVVFSAPDFDTSIVLPVGGATLSYIFDLAQFSASYGYGANANVFTGDVTANHRVTGRATWPLPFAENLGVTAAAGYRRGKFIDFNADQLTGRTEQLTMSISTAYQLNRFWSLSGRIQTNRQLREDSFIGSEFGIARRTVNLVLTGSWPNSNALLSAPGGTERVDAQNEAAIEER